jgi:hypothetical protein
MPIYTYLMKSKFKCIKRLRFENIFSPDFLEFTIVVLHVFSRFVLNFQNFQILN